MLLGGKGGCQQCTCVPCDACTRTCTEPHSGTAFEPVYTRFFEGVEVGNPTDGYLSASGDSDTSDPYDGMDGTGPWFQQVGGGFSDGGSYGGGTRFPCTYRFSFWRSSYTLGTATIPPASTALTENVITVTVSTGAVVFPDGRVITSADGAVTLTSVPLVSGGALAADPRTNDGTVSFALQCQNTETTFSVQARIEWNTQKRQHVLYGIVRECYEDGTPCATVCSGSPPPETIYLTIKNVSLSDGVTLDGFAGTYAMHRIPNFCETYASETSAGCTGSGLAFDYVYATWTAINGSSPYGVNRPATKSGQTLCSRVTFSWYNATPVPICGTGSIKSGSSGAVTVINPSFSATGTFDWEISA